MLCCLMIFLTPIFDISAAYAQNEDDSLIISVLTCARGEEIYTSFGHCAFRVVDLRRGTDCVFNYGAFNFNTPYFPLKFARGLLNYYVSTPYYKSFYREYSRDKRDVCMQTLNLSAFQADTLYKFLLWNSLEQNRYYKYDFLNDNCATRIRDCMLKVCGDSIIFPQETYDITFRQLIHQRIADMPWYRFGIDLLMGMPADKKADSRTVMFLPDYIKLIFEDARVIRNGDMLPLIKKSEMLLKYDQPVNRTDFSTYFSPSVLFWAFFLLVAFLTYREYVNKTHYKIVDCVILSVAGLFGFLFIFMWFFTDHDVTVWNMNILWANPFHLFASFATRLRRKFWINYFKFTAWLTLSLMVLSPVLPQQFDVAFYPILCLLIVRLFRSGYFEKLKFGV